MRRAGIMAVLVAFAACGGGAGESPDFGASDLPSQDVALLSDAVVLEPGGTADAEAPRDLPSPQDAAGDLGAADAGPTWDATVPDAGAADAVDFPDAAGDPGVAPADVPSPPDTPPAGDAWNGIPCGDDGLTCGADQACVVNSDGQAFCSNLEECSGKGAMDLDELVRLLLMGQGEVHVKVLATAWPGKPACSPKPCPAENPCCNTCFAPLFIGAEAFPIALMGQGVAVGCQGTECDVLDLCHPFDQGAWYWVWGVASVMGGRPQFLVEGYCPAHLDDGPF